MKKCLAFLLTVLFVATISVSAFAEPMRAPSANTGLYFSGTTAHCSATVRGANQQITVTMSLWDGNTCIASWSDSGKTLVSMSETCTVEAGKSYTLQVSGTVGGSPISATPLTKTCSG